MKVSQPNLSILQAFLKASQAQVESKVLGSNNCCQFVLSFGLLANEVVSGSLRL